MLYSPSLAEGNLKIEIAIVCPQVVLPILYNDLVQSDCTTVNGKDVCTVRADSWMTADEFYTGLAVVQAMPGPLFNIAAYCGQFTTPVPQRNRPMKYVI